MCLGMNPDILDAYERCASTSNRNFEGRQGALSRTHLMSPAMAAAAGIAGHFVDIREFEYKDQDQSSPKVEVTSEDEKELESAAYDHAEPVQPEDAPQDIANDELKDIPVKSDDTPAKPSSSGMKPFLTLEGISAPLDKANVDTDAIIPKQFLKTIKRTGLKKGCFMNGVSVKTIKVRIKKPILY